MKLILITVFLVVPTFPVHAVGAARADAMCAPIQSFVASVGPNEKRELIFHTLWGGNFKGESEPAIYAKRCMHSGYAPAKAACAFLMDHGSIEFAGFNVERALSCLSPQTKFGPHVSLNKGIFSLSYGTPNRGSIVTVEFQEDAQLGGMVFRIEVVGY